MHITIFVQAYGMVCGEVIQRELTKDPKEIFAYKVYATFSDLLMIYRYILYQNLPKYTFKITGIDFTVCNPL